MQQAEAAKNHMKQKADRLNQEIRIAYTSSVSYRFIPRLLRDFTAECKKEYLIYSDERPSQEIADGLKAGHFDLGICSKIESDPDIRQISLSDISHASPSGKRGKRNDLIYQKDICKRLTFSELSLLHNTAAAECRDHYCGSSDDCAAAQHPSYSQASQE